MRLLLSMETQPSGKSLLGIHVFPVRMNLALTCAMNLMMQVFHGNILLLYISQNFIISSSLSFDLVEFLNYMSLQVHQVEEMCEQDIFC